MEDLSDTYSLKRFKMESECDQSSEFYFAEEVPSQVFTWDINKLFEYE